MMKVIKLIIDNNSSFYFGDGVSGIKDNLSSDQIFSALINNFSSLYPDQVDNLIKSFNGANIKISSLFYGLDLVGLEEKINNSTIYFLPKPNISYFAGKNTILEAKSLKKVKYVSISLLKVIAKNWNPSDHGILIADINFKILGNNFAITEEEFKNHIIGKTDLRDFKIFNFKYRPRVTVDRWIKEDEQTHFYEESLKISNYAMRKYQVNPFHYFFIKGDLSSKIISGIRLMAEEGLGGKRSTGAGFYQDVEFEDININMPEGNYKYSLSTIFPDENDLNNLYNYDLDKREGYIFSKRGSSIRKPRLRVLKEGSIYSGVVNGKVIDITPAAFQGDHNIYFNGKSFLLDFGGE